MNIFKERITELSLLLIETKDEELKHDIRVRIMECYHLMKKHGHYRKIN
jgi:hypothetical protein